MGLSDGACMLHSVEEETVPFDRYSLAMKIRGERQTRRISTAALAKHAGMSRAQLSRIEHGQANPRIGTLIALADAMGVSLDELCCRRRIRRDLTHPGFRK